MSRLQAAMYQLTQSEESAVNLAATLLRAVIEGLQIAIEEDESLKEILDFNASLHEKELAELNNVTIPRLIELEAQGKLTGWLL
jgi:hypothetical protein